MMDDSLVSVLRMLERLLVVGFGGMAIYLGYKLFFHLPYQADHEGKLEIPGVKIVLSRVAPGVFFLAFGAIVLLQSLNNGIEQRKSLSSHSLVNNKKEIVETFAGASDLSGNGDNKGIAQRRSAAIEQVGELNCLIKKLAAKKVEISASMRIAHHDAKIALLKPVWNTSAWGNIEILEFDSETIENKNLKGVFTDVSVSCQY